MRTRIEETAEKKRNNLHILQVSIISSLKSENGQKKNKKEILDILSFGKRKYPARNDPTRKRKRNWEEKQLIVGEWRMKKMKI
uniref:Uncharacterized protein n=1 Tax=Caenorhabditis tropicalis TaxID=1561998 RepID=A0A1I7UJX7_9PELO